MQSQTGSPAHTWTYGNETEAGVLLGVGKFKTDIILGSQKRVKNDEIVAALQTINGIRYKGRLFLGAGVGVEFWQHGLFFPVFGHLSYDIKPADNTFFGSVSLGSSIGERHETSFYAAGAGGFMATVGLGYKMKVARKLKFLYEIFYKYQAIFSTYTIETAVTDSTYKTSDPIGYKVPNHFIGFRIGIVY